MKPMANQLLDTFLQLRAIWHTQSAVCNLSFSVNEEALRQEAYSAVSIGNTGVPKKHRILHAAFPSEPGDFRLRSRIIQRHADNLHSLRSVLLVQLHEPWHFHSARRAPRCPEIQQHWPTSQPGQSQPASIDRRQFKIRSGVSGLKSNIDL
jgi:hypothetical protein